MRQDNTNDFVMEFLFALKRIGAWAVGAIILLLAVFLFVFSGETSREGERVTNPAKTIDAAVVWTGGGGAAGWTKTEVYVMSSGEPYKNGASLKFQVNYPQTLNLSWDDSDHLLIRLVCEEFPGKPEATTLSAGGKRITANIEYVDCNKTAQ